jgi:hypothetical protein
VASVRNFLKLSYLICTVSICLALLEPYNKAQIFSSIMKLLDFRLEFHLKFGDFLGAAQNLVPPFNS